MFERKQCVSKSSKSQYDPQVGAAAAANVALAEKSQAWTEDFYEKHITPMLEATAKSTAENTRMQGELFDINKRQLDTADERYRRLGIPAEDAYFKMAKDYSAPEEEERQASAALGDQRVAASGRDQQLMRKFAGLGVDPTSPAGMAAMSDFAVQDAAAEAAAQTRARGAAKTLGMALTSDAANFGRGGTSAILGFGGAAGGNASNPAQIAQGSTGAATGAASPMLGAFGVAGKAYGANLDAYTSLAKADMEQKAAGAAGFGQLLGTVASAFIK